MALAEEAWPGKFGVYYQSEMPTKNELEKEMIDSAREKTGGKSDAELLSAAFKRMR